MKQKILTGQKKRFILKTNNLVCILHHRFYSDKNNPDDVLDENSNTSTKEIKAIML